MGRFPRTLDYFFDNNIDPTNIKVIIPPKTKLPAQTLGFMSSSIIPSSPQLPLTPLFPI